MAATGKQGGVREVAPTQVEMVGRQWLARKRSVRLRVKRGETLKTGRWGDGEAFVTASEDDGGERGYSATGNKGLGDRQRGQNV